MRPIADGICRASIETPSTHSSRLKSLPSTQVCAPPKASRNADLDTELPLGGKGPGPIALLNLASSVFPSDLRLSSHSSGRRCWCIAAGFRSLHAGKFRTTLSELTHGNGQRTATHKNLSSYGGAGFRLAASATGSGDWLCSAPK